MSDLDISSLFRIVSPLLSSQTQLQNSVAPLRAAADSDGVANEEDHTLTEEEARQYLNHMREETRTALSLLTANREALVGSLSSANRILRNAGASDSLTSLVGVAASQDEQHTELSTEEIELLIHSLESDQSQQSSTTVASFMRDARELMGQIRALEAETPEAFIPESPSAQRAPVDLNFLKLLPPTLFSGEGDQAQILQILVGYGSVNLEDRESNWDISLEDIQQRYAEANDTERAGLPPAEEMLANLRFLAHVQEDSVNTGLATAAAEGDESTLDLSELIDRRQEFSSDPRVDLILQNAGDDGVLTILEVRRMIVRLQESDPTFSVEPQVYLAGARRFVHDLLRASPQARAEAAAEPLLTREEYLNQLVLEDLRSMQTGFTHRDMQYATEDSLPNFINGIVWFCQGAVTLTTYHTVFDAPTYEDLLVESVESHDHEREVARQALERLVTSPDPEFMHWLEGRPEGERMVTIPNALEYLHTHDDSLLPGRNQRNYALLTGPLFQADRLWEIRNMSDATEQGQAWFAFAQELRSGINLGWSDQSHLDIISNWEYSRTILASLMRESTDPELRHQARHALEDSTGVNITDDEGHTVERGGGEFGLWPVNWFRNYSDENVSGAWSDAILLVASWVIGSAVFKGFTSFTSAARVGLARAALWESVLGFFGVRTVPAAATAVATGAVETAAAEGQGIYRVLFNRFFGSWIQRRVLAAEAEAVLAREGLVSAQAGGNIAEINAARATLRTAEEALRNAQGVHQILTSPLSLTQQATAAVSERMAPRVSPWMQRISTRMSSIPLNMENPLVRATVATASYSWTAASFLARQSGRFLNYAMYEGFVTYWLAGLIFEACPRHHSHWSEYDHEHFLELPEANPEESPESDSDSSSDSGRTSPAPAPHGDSDSATDSPPPRGLVESDE